MHQNKGKTIADCLADRTDYAINPDKTNGGELVSAYECDPMTVQAEFLLSKRKYDDITGLYRTLTISMIADVYSHIIDEDQVQKLSKVRECLL